MARLYVKVDHVASLREVRRSSQPDPVIAAALAELGGADGIIAHLRGDRRHITERDLELLRQTVTTKLVLEMTHSPDLVKVALHVKPDQVTLVAERPDEVTIEGGLDVVRHRDAVQKAVASLKEAGIQVGLLIEPDIDQVRAGHRLDTDLVVINAARYCDAKQQVDRFHAYNGILVTAKAAEKLKLGVAVAQGLQNAHLKDLHGIAEIEAFYMGFSIVARAMLVGFERAVRETGDLVR